MKGQRIKILKTAQALYSKLCAQDFVTKIAPVNQR